MRGNAARVLLPALVVLALVGVVAIAATGSTSTGTGEVRPPSATLLDTILSLGFVAVLAGGVLLLYGLTQRKAISREVASGRYRRTSLLGFLTFMSIIMVVAYWRLGEWELVPVEEEAADPAFSGSVPAPDATGSGNSVATYEPAFAWLPVILVLGLATAAVAAYVVAVRRSTRSTRAQESLAEHLATVFDDTLDDLRAESDPRRAVIAAYARLERVLAAHDIARRGAETPEEYLTRILGALTIDAEAVRRLTDLFSRAKFSQHAVDLAMKEEAIEALEHVRDELRAAAAMPEALSAGELVATGARS
ncbi:MAG: DUF4129 domain-containing protein [Thermoleophilia bacterium]|nr:DUF4129 domain-containing protein [Thermoleophilia bacterium]MDH4338830.1 DUF4129 domain-containing protein [Thermoleophilia bacterium]MDH5279681.1 DUF4129 domain-containing protein [Thermoleophilia bacterium]